MKTTHVITFCSALLIAGTLLVYPTYTHAQDTKKVESSKAPIPPQNSRKSTAKSTPLPDAKLSHERAKLLVEAIRKNDPSIAHPFFFPQEPFRALKAIANPDRYHKRLVAIYDRDVKALRKTFKNPDAITFINFELSRKKRWKEVGSEGNNYPYWSMYKATVTVQDGDKEKTIRLRVIIHWGDQWYVTHLTNMK